MISRTQVLAETAVPRYTSYPTAPQFKQDVTASRYASWLSALPETATLSLYIHVPYCVQLCRYCGCHTKVARRREPIDSYADRLLEELILLGPYIGGRKLAHLHWGGGTPSILGSNWIAEIYAKLAKIFDIAIACEHAIELDPRHVSRELVDSLAGIGVNRASLGVQDFTASVQRAIGRIQPFEIVERSVAALRYAGIERINLDLMYGLPRQGVDDVRRSAALAASLRPQRLAYFGYAHVPWVKKHQRVIDETTLPGAVERLEQAEAARETLAAHGYVPIGLDHFALPHDELAAAARAGGLHRNFQGYTTDQADALIGVGASAISRLPQGFAQNLSDIGSYAGAITSGHFATARGLALSADDLLRGRIIERLMCDFSVDLEAMANKNDFAAANDFARELQALNPLETEGMVRRDGKRVVVTEKGRPFVRLVTAVFDAYLPNSSTRHSVAV
jgi:oxygen-independent coproporphyrinogen-3 oxidase